MSAPKKNRWLIAASAIFIHLSIGAAYAYSVYTQPLVEAKGWSMASVTTAFTIMMVLGGGSAALFGKFTKIWSTQKHFKNTVMQPFDPA